MNRMLYFFLLAVVVVLLVVVMVRKRRSVVDRSIDVLSNLLDLLFIFFFTSLLNML